MQNYYLILLSVGGIHNSIGHWIGKAALQLYVLLMLCTFIAILFDTPGNDTLQAHI